MSANRWVVVAEDCFETLRKHMGSKSICDNKDSSKKDIVDTTVDDTTVDDTTVDSTVEKIRANSEPPPPLADPLTETEPPSNIEEKEENTVVEEEEKKATTIKTPEDKYNNKKDKIERWLEKALTPGYIEDGRTLIKKLFNIEEFDLDDNVNQSLKMTSPWKNIYTLKESTTAARRPARLATSKRS